MRWRNRFPFRTERNHTSAPALLVTLGEGIRFDQARLVHHVHLAVLLPVPDTQLAPQVVVGVDLDVSLGRGFQLDAGRGRDYLVNIEAAGLFDRRLPQPRAEIRGLGHVTDYAVGAI